MSSPDMADQDKVPEEVNNDDKAQIELANANLNAQGSKKEPSPENKP